MEYRDVIQAVSDGAFDWIEDKAVRRAKKVADLICGGRFPASDNVDDQLQKLGFVLIEPLGGFCASIWEKGQLRLLLEMDCDYKFWHVTPIAKSQDIPSSPISLF